MEGVEDFIKSLDRYRTGMCPISEVADTYYSFGNFQNFEKYLADTEIRAKDAQYSITQEGALSTFVRHLKNKDYESARSVTFSGT